jgi:16S rRNA (cytidine1402-2'-O)-methyltransferase
MTSTSIIYLIPTFLDEDSLESLPLYLAEALKKCEVFFVENERTARRFAKRIWKEMVIDNYDWITLHKAEDKVMDIFRQKLKESRTIGIMSEAGCPGVADPGQILVTLAQQAGATVRPLVGPSSILLALMASGMNGQHFHFSGYLPIESRSRAQKIRELESESRRSGATQIFIETPYRNGQVLETILQTCQGATLLCIATELTSDKESIRTKTIEEWKTALPELHKKPTVFLLLARS